MKPLLFIILTLTISVSLAFKLDFPVGPDDLDPYIINGKVAAPGAVPYQALLYLTMKDGGNSLCGGSLISSRVVLTAAHCVQGVSTVTVLLGTTKSRTLTPGTVVDMVPSTSIVAHSEYSNRTFRNDIAVIKLSFAVNTAGNINTIRLPSRMQMLPRLFGTAEAQISGWGLTKQGGSANSDLMVAKVRVWMDQLCKMYTGYRESGKICTSTAVSATCMGDSGGPLVVVERDGTPTLVGIVSYLVYGPGRDCKTARVNVYTFTGAYLDWIQQVAGVPVRP